MSTVYMNLTLPVPTVTLGPEWANELNAAIEIIDAHDHTAGRGQLITPAAMNINDNLAIQGNNLTSARSYNMQNQGSAISEPTDVRSLYSVNGELFYNDGVGNQIQITSGGALDASSVGGIGGDYGTSTANVYYNSINKTFYFDQDVDQRAKLAVGDLLISDTSIASADPITLKSPASLPGPYTLTLPSALPASTTLPLVSTTAGALSFAQIVEAMIATDAVTNTKIQDGSISTTKIIDDNVTAAKIDPTAKVVTFVEEVLSGSGTWTKPAGLVSDVVIARIVGGGGGGGSGSGATGSLQKSAGGGEGAQVHNVILPVPNASYAYSVGAAGTGGASVGDGVSGNNGTAGGDSTFAGFTAYGGGGGNAGTTTNATSTFTQTPKSWTTAGGGVNTAGEDSNYASGGTAGSAAAVAGGGGGGASLGAGGNGANSQALSNQTGNPGGDASGFGAGGGGGTGSSGTGGHPSGAGGDGSPGTILLGYWVNVNP